MVEFNEWIVKENEKVPMNIIPKNAKLVFAFDAATEEAMGSSSGAPWNHLVI